MIKFICNTCKATKELMKATIVLREGRWVTKQALCSCGEYMQELEKDFSGFPDLIRTEPTLNKKRDKLWKSAKEKLIGERGINEPFK
jgi:hypothetical protein